MDSEKIKKWGLAAFVLGLLNFAAFFVVAVKLGGDAVNGHETAGRYFLASHGKMTEVSRNVFLYSKMHVYSLFITHPLAILGGMAAGRRPR